MSNENFDFLLEEQDDNLNQDRLERISTLCSMYRDLEKNIVELELKLKSKKEELEQVSRISIPSILNEVGLSEVKLSTGEKVTIEDKLKASISDKNFILAFNNMIKAEGGDESAEEKIESLFKTKVTISDVKEETLDKLLDLDISYDLKKEIHWKTLQRYCSEKLDQGEEIPEGISVFQYQETKIK